MKKLLVVLFVVFLIVDALLATVIFTPSINKRAMSILGGPSICKVLESQHCRQIKLKQSSYGDFQMAIATVPRGAKVFAPVDGVIEYNERSLEMLGTERLPLHYLRSSKGDIYILLFENIQTITGEKNVAAGETIGITSGKPLHVIDGHNFGMTIFKNRVFSAQSFKSLFGK